MSVLDAIAIVLLAYVVGRVVFDAIVWVFLEDEL